MGFPERSVDRQLDRGDGDWAQRTLAVRRAQRWLTASVAVNLLGFVPYAVLTDVFDRRWSIGLAATWLGVAYVLHRQRTSLRRRVEQGPPPRA